MKCWFCGEWLPEHTKVCQWCGRAQKNNPESSPAIAQTQPVNIRKENALRPGTKRCPFCAEVIQEAAIICRYCQRELNAKPAKNAWKFITLVLHFRNMDESGWLSAEHYQVDQAANHFYNTMSKYKGLWDANLTTSGWIIVEPRGPGCIQLEKTRNSKGYNPVASVFSAVFSMGGSLIGQAIGYEKYWPSSIILRWRKPAEKNEEETVNFWMNIQNNNEWERMEVNPTDGKWYIWRRPKDYNEDDPNDDRWDKIKC